MRRRRRRESEDLRRGSLEGRGGRRESWEDNGEERERRDRTAIIRRQKESSRLIDPFCEYPPSLFQQKFKSGDGGNSERRQLGASLQQGVLIFPLGPGGGKTRWKVFRNL